MIVVCQRFKSASFENSVLRYCGFELAVLWPHHRHNLIRKPKNGNKEALTEGLRSRDGSYRIHKTKCTTCEKYF